MSSRDIGFEIFFKSICNTFKSRNDALVAKLHWILLQNGFKCVGSDGDMKSLDPQSELLPSNWNSNKDLYQLKYIKDEKKYLLKIVISSENMLIHINKDGDKDTYFTQVKTDEYVSSDYKKFEKAYQNIQAFDKKIIDELLHSYVYSQNPGPKTQSSTSNPLADTSLPSSTKPEITTYSKYDEEDFFRNTIQPQPPQGRIPSNPANEPFFEPPWRDRNPDLFPNIPSGVGRGDLDPLGRSGPPGMLFDPSRNMGGRPFDPNAGLPGPDLLPRGAVPPGARFDPFVPNFTNQTPPDHMRPPGSDDAYM